MSKFESVKNHLRNNKVTYIACGATAVIVAGTTYYFTRNGSATKQALELVGETVVNNAPKQALCYKPTMKNVIEFVERSTPSKQIGLVDEATGLIVDAFSSIGEAARATGIDRSLISKVINGSLEQAKGEKFVLLEPLLTAAA